MHIVHLDWERNKKEEEKEEADLLLLLTTTILSFVFALDDCVCFSADQLLMTAGALCLVGCFK